MIRKNIKKLNNNNSISFEITLATIQLTFIILRITNTVDWSWLSIFIPVFIYLGCWIVTFILAVICLAIVGIDNDKED